MKNVNSEIVSMLPKIGTNQQKPNNSIKSGDNSKSMQRKKSLFDEA